MPDTSLVLNAFQSVRPRGVDRPSAAPLKRGPGRPPMMLPGSHMRALDSSGRVRSEPLSLAQRGFVIENRKTAQVSNDKRRALVKGGL